MRNAAAAANGPMTRLASEMAMRIKNEDSKAPDCSVTAPTAEMPKISVGM